MKKHFKMIVATILCVSIIFSVNPIISNAAVLHVVPNGFGGYTIYQTPSGFEIYMQQYYANQQNIASAERSVGIVSSQNYGEFHIGIFGSGQYQPSYTPITNDKNHTGIFTIYAMIFNGNKNTIGIAKDMSCIDAAGNILDENFSISNTSTYTYCPIQTNQYIVVPIQFYTTPDTDLSKITLSYAYKDYSTSYWTDYSSFINNTGMTFMQILSRYPTQKVMTFSIVSNSAK